MNERGLCTLRPRTATFIVLATGYLGRRIARLASEHASFDSERRRVLRQGDADFPETERIETWRRATTTVAVILDHRGEVCQQLDAVRATTGGWIEDAFLRANRETA
jgi:hypothetical protein